MEAYEAEVEQKERDKDMKFFRNYTHRLIVS